MTYSGPIFFGAFIAAELILLFRGFFVVSQTPIFHLPIILVVLLLLYTIIISLASHTKRFLKKFEDFHYISGSAIYIIPLSILVFHMKTWLGLSFNSTLPWYAISIYPFIIFIPFSIMHISPAGSIIKDKSYHPYFFMGAFVYSLADHMFFWSYDFLTQAVLASTLGLCAAAAFSKETLPRYTNYALAGIAFLLASSSIPLQVNTVIRSFVREYNTGFIDMEQTPYGELNIHKKKNRYIFSINHKKLLTYPDNKNSTELIHTAMLQYPWAESILLIGEWDTAINEILRYPNINNVYWASPVPQIFNKGLDIIKHSLKVPEKIRILRESDPREFINKIKYEKIFDIVILSIPDPKNIFLNRYYSYEFFKELSTVISDNSMLLVTFDSFEQDTGLGDEHLRSLVYNTVKRIYPNTLELGGSRLYLLASFNRNFTTSHKALGEFLNAIDGIPEYISPAMIKYQLSSRDKAKSLLENKVFDINTDSKPASLGYSLVELLYSFGIINREVIHTIKTTKPVFIYSLITALCFIFLILASRLNLDRKLLIVVSGCSFAFVMYFFDIALLIHTNNGQLFRDISYLAVMISAGACITSLMFKMLNKRMYVATSRFLMMLSSLYLILLPAGLELSYSRISNFLLFFISISGLILIYGIIHSSYFAFVELNGDYNLTRLLKYTLLSTIAACFLILIMIPVLGIIDFLPVIAVLCLTGVMLISI